MVAVMHHKDAENFDLHPLDRIKVKIGKRSEIAILDVDTSGCVLSQGQLGLFDEIVRSIKPRKKAVAEIIPMPKPQSVEFIKKKLDGHTLTKYEIDLIVKDIVDNRLTDIELTYFVSACYTHAMSMTETVFLTEAMTQQGDILNVRKYPILDKHCIGGVAGNRTTMIVVPIIAAAGLTIPKTSSRAITSPAGTADTMEVLCDVCLNLKTMSKVVRRINGCIVWGGALNLAPADDKIIKVERPLSIDAESQLLASIMAKKLSVSSTHILIDIPVGVGAKIENRKTAYKLKSHFEKIARLLGVKVKVIITDGRNPIGRGMGPALEARDVLWVLSGDKRGPSDLRKKSVMMAGHLLEIGGKAKKGNGKKLAEEILASGKAYDKFIQIINSQGRKHVSPSTIPLGKHIFDIRSSKKGVVKRISNKRISRIARVAGAPMDSGAGVYLVKVAGDKVKKGDTLFTIHAESKFKLHYAIQIYKHHGAYEIE